MAEELVFRISGDSAGASRAIGEAVRSLKSLGDSAREASGHAQALGANTSSALDTFKGFAGAQLALRGLSTAYDAIKSSTIGMNSMLESSTFQFETLMGSADKARAHVKDLFDIAKKTPFETGPIIQASRMLQTFGGNALNTKSNIMMIGDAAAATQAPINELGFWVGRLYSQVKGGQPFGEAAMRLQELAVMTPEARREMEKMQKAGKSADETWQVFAESLGKFSGAMEKQAKTWSGVTSTLSDIINLTIADAFKPFFDVLKDGIGTFNDWTESDQGKRFFVSIKDSVQEVYNVLRFDVIPTIEKVGKAALDTGEWFVDKWSALPQPIKNVATELGEVAVAIWAIKTAMDAVAASGAFKWLMAGGVKGALGKIAYRLPGKSLPGVGTMLPGALVPGSLGVGALAVGGTYANWKVAQAWNWERERLTNQSAEALGWDGSTLATSAPAGWGAAGGGAFDPANLMSGAGGVPGFTMAEIDKLNPTEKTKAQEKEAEKIKGIREELFGDKAIKKAKEYMAAVKGATKLAGEELDKYRKVLLEGAQAAEQLGKASVAATMRAAIAGSMLPTGGAPTGMGAYMGASATGVPAWVSALGGSMTDWNNQPVVGKKPSPITLATGTDWTGVPSWVNAFVAKASGAPTVTTAQDFASRMNASPFGAFAMTPHLAKGAGSLSAPKTPSMWGGTSSMVSNLGGTILGAVQGGGNVGGSIGSSILGSVMGDVGKKVVGAIGGKLGGLVGGALGPLGGLAGSLIGAGIGKLFGGGGPTKTQQAGRDADKETDKIKESLLKTYGSLENIKNMGGEAGKALAQVWDRRGVDGLKLITEAANKFGEAVAKSTDRVKRLSKEGKVFDKEAFKTLKTMSKEDMAAIMTEQAANGVDAITRLASGAMERAGMTARMKEIEKERSGYLGRSLSGSERGEADKLDAEWDDLKGKIAEFDKKNTLSKLSAQGIGSGVAGVYAQMLENGSSRDEIVQTLGPQIAALKEQFKALGVDGGAAFNEIAKSVDYLNTEGVAPLLDKSDAAVDLMAVLSNTGRMNQDTFKGLSATVGETASQLTLMGKGGGEMFTALQPQLQKMWEMEQQFGYKADDATQALIDQGVASGQIGDKFREPADKMLAAIDKLVSRMGDFIDTIMGVPKAVAGLPKDIDLNTRVKYTYVRDGSGDVPEGAGTEPFPSFDDRTLERVVRPGLAMLHPGDVVGVPRPGMFGGGNSVTVQLNVTAMDGKDAKRVVLGTLPDIVDAIKDNLGGNGTKLKIAMGTA